ncbi:hypothetical protein A8139_16630 [Marinomonas primoryensis]|uniref:Uncharacterized protein n=1 Tax=Marinomonas primoryensis TaxID=178399 RepID=A0A2Z4PV88_9GAMM|nr:hypothetical protein [Marinomonas primoryensis]AWY01400.1 hypothetical protein A8139_16630 [Marinomonas primoryensis]
MKNTATSIKEQDLDGTLGLVDYFDEYEFHGNMPEDKLGYQKRSFFARQREYRIKIDTRNAIPTSYTLDVGDLNDIALITTTREFNDQLKIKLPDGSNA